MGHVANDRRLLSVCSTRGEKQKPSGPGTSWSPLSSVVALTDRNHERRHHWARKHLSQTAATTRDMYLADYTWPELGDYFAEESLAVIPLGSTEQHGPYLPLATDYLIDYHGIDNSENGIRRPDGRYPGEGRAVVRSRDRATGEPAGVARREAVRRSAGETARRSAARESAVREVRSPAVSCRRSRARSPTCSCSSCTGVRGRRRCWCCLRPGRC